MKSLSKPPDSRRHRYMLVVRNNSKYRVIEEERSIFQSSMNYLLLYHLPIPIFFSLSRVDWCAASHSPVLRTKSLRCCRSLMYWTPNSSATCRSSSRRRRRTSRCTRMDALRRDPVIGPQGQSYDSKRRHRPQRRPPPTLLHLRPPSNASTARASTPTLASRFRSPPHSPRLVRWLPLALLISTRSWQRPTRSRSLPRRSRSRRRPTGDVAHGLFPTVVRRLASVTLSARCPFCYKSFYAPLSISLDCTLVHYLIVLVHSYRVNRSDDHYELYTSTLKTSSTDTAYAYCTSICMCSVLIYVLTRHCIARKAKSVLPICVGAKAQRKRPRGKIRWRSTKIPKVSHLISWCARSQWILLQTPERF